MQITANETLAIEARMAEIPVTPATAMLHALLDASHGLPPEYRHGLSNHMPMALHALHAMGAGTQRMLDFYTSYARRFEAGAKAGRMAPVADWLLLRGQGDRDPGAYPALVATFERMLAREGELAVAAPRPARPAARHRGGRLPWRDPHGPRGAGRAPGGTGPWAGLLGLALAGAGVGARGGRPAELCRLGGSPRGGVRRPAPGRAADLAADWRWPRRRPSTFRWAGPCVRNPAC